MIYGMGSIVPRILNYFLVPLYTRIFSPSEYGVITELYAYVTFLLVILTYGLETGYFRFSNNSDYRENNVFSVSFLSILCTSSLFVLLVNFFIDPIAGAMQYEKHSEYIQWFSIILALDTLIAVPFARLRMEKKAFKFAIFKIFNVSINIFFNLLFLIIFPALQKDGIDLIGMGIYNPSIGVGYVIISNLIASVSTALLFVGIILKVKFTFNKKLYLKILKYSLPLLIAGLAGTINETLDRAILKHLLPEESNPLKQLGLYGANVKVAVLMTLFIQMFRFAAEPFFFEYEKEKGSKKIFADVMKYFIIFGIFIFLGIMLFMDVVKFFVGEDFRSGLDIVPILLIANLFLGIFYNLSIWYKLTNRTGFGALLTGIGAIITISVNIIFVPEYGYHASAWAHLLCYFSIVVISYFIGRKYYPVKYDLKSITFYLFLGLGLYFLKISVHIGINFLEYIFSIFLQGLFIFVILKKEKIDVPRLVHSVLKKSKQ